MKDVFIANGYPNNLMERTVQDSWKIELEKELKKIAEELRKAELDTHRRRKPIKNTLMSYMHHTLLDSQKDCRKI